MPYKAFVSYSHAADGKLAPTLQAALERFAKPWNQMRAMRVFVDKASLSANPGLWSTIEAALDESEYFLLLASPSSAQSLWVQKEVEHWAQLGRARQLLIALTEGDIVWAQGDGDFDWNQSTALPRALRQTMPEEPLYVDLRWVKSESQLSLQDPRFTDAVASLAARMRGIPKDDLYGEHVLQHRKAVRLRRIATTALAVLTLAALAASVVALRQRNEAIRQANMAVGRQLAAQSESARIQGARLLPYSLLLAVESMRTFPSVEADQAIRDGLSLIPRQLAVMQHEDAVTAIAVQPQGGRIATGTAGGVLRVWNADGGGERRLLEHHGRLSRLVFSPDGKRLAAATWNRLVGIWDADSGKQTSSGQLPVGRTDRIAFSADGTLLAANTLAGSASTVTVWNATTGALIRTLPLDRGTENSQGLAFGDGVLACVAYSRIRAWDTNTWNELPPPPDIPPASFADIRFLPDGKHLVAGGGSGKLWIWDLSARKTVVVEAPTLSAIAISADGKYVAAATRAGQVQVWQSEDWKTVTTVTHGAEIASLAFSASGTILAAAGADGLATLWAIPGGQKLASLDHGGAVAGVAFTADGRRMVTASADKSARIWAAGAGADVAEMPGGEDSTIAFATHVPAFVKLGDQSVWIWRPAESRMETVPLADPMESPTLSPNGQFIAGSGADGVVRIIDVFAKREAAMLPHPGTVDWDEYLRRAQQHGILGAHTAAGRVLEDRRDIVNASEFSGDGKYLLTTRHDFLARIWDVAARRVIATEPYEFFRIPAYTFSRDGRFVILRKDSNLAVLELPSGRKVLSADSSQWESPVRISDNGAIVAIAEEVRGSERTRRARLWRSADWHALPDVALTRSDDDVELSPSGEFLGAGVGSTTVRIVRVQSGAEAARLVFSRDSRTAAAASEDRTVRIFDLAANQPMPQLALTEPVNDVALSPDGGHVAAAGATYTRVFSVRDGQELARLAPRDAVRRVQFSPDGAYVITTDDESTRVWAWRSADVLDEACRRLARHITEAQWPPVTGVSFQATIDRVCGASQR